MLSVKQASAPPLPPLVCTHGFNGQTDDCIVLLKYCTSHLPLRCDGRAKSGQRAGRLTWCIERRGSIQVLQVKCNCCIGEGGVMENRQYCGVLLLTPDILVVPPLVSIHFNQIGELFALL